MINANELRIGNALLYKGEIIIVKMFSPHTVYYGSDKQQSLNFIDPIPLDPGILEACGYKKLGDRYFNQEADIGVIGWVRPGEYCLNSIPIISPNIKYLHQLQNLFFALKGQELTVNLEKVKV